MAHNPEDNTVFGFWVYLMTDCVLFASLFATYAVLHNSTYGGVSSRDIFDLPYVLKETMILLTSSFTCGLAMLAAHKNSIKITQFWLFITGLLGFIFLGLEMTEFSKLIADGHGPDKSAFLTSYFSLVGTHGIHIAVGLFMLLVLLVRIGYRGLTPTTLRKLTWFSLFWHFLDLIWIFIFTIVYLMGVA